MRVRTDNDLRAVSHPHCALLHIWRHSFSPGGRISSILEPQTLHTRVCDKGEHTTLALRALFSCRLRQETACLRAVPRWLCQEAARLRALDGRLQPCQSERSRWL